MDEFERYQPDEWSRDGVTTVRRLRPDRHFVKRAKEKWVAVAAKATVITIAVAALASTALVATPKSDLVQHAAFADTRVPAKVHSELANVEPGYWPKLIRFLDQFPRDDTPNTNFDPDPFT